VNLEPILDRLAAATGADPRAVGLPTVVAAIRRRMRETGLGAPEEYARLLAADAAEVGRLVDASVVNETWFFRYPASFDLLVEDARARLSEDPSRPYEVSCVACATGEEPASVAIAFREAGLPLARLRLRASDVSAGLVARAREGRYGPRSFRGMDALRRSRHFQAAKGSWTLDPALRAAIRYEVGNALDLAGPKGAALDALFCRNLLIYLPPEGRTRLMDRLLGALRPGGLLLLGHAEMSAARERGLAIADPAEAFACRNLRRSAPPAARLPALRPAAVARVAPGRPHAARAAPLRPAPRTPDEAPDPAGVLGTARRLADAGRLAEARRHLDAERHAGRVSAALFHLLATVHGALGQEAEAEASLVRAIYLEPDHAPSLHQLALLLAARGEEASSRRLKARAARAEVRATAQAPTPEERSGRGEG
jgi:chemotaxis protein methyltransferase WspC